MMGFTPDQVEAMSLWQFHAARAGWLAAQGVKMRAPHSEDAFEAASALLDRALAAEEG